MRALVVACHPNPQSYSAHLRDTVMDALAARGAEARLRDLYAEGFDPVMSCAERLSYHDEGSNEEPVAGELADIRWCDTLIFVYPTWWFGPPAVLKGWLDRVFVPHATFVMPTATEGVGPNLTHITRLMVVTTCGASWLQSKLVGEPGRRTILRGLRSLFAPRCRTRYAALYKMDTASRETLERYAKQVSGLVAKL